MHKIKFSISLLLFILLFITSCNGLSKDTGKIQKSNLSEHPKTLKLQGKNTAASIGYAIQDKLGNIWFASNGDGLYFYDGKTFTNYREEDGLDNNIIYSLLEDNIGNIWVGTKTGLNRHTPDKDTNNRKTFSTITITTTNRSSFNSSNDNLQNQSGGVWSIMQDKDGTIWFGTDEGVYCSDGTNFTRFLDTKKVINTDSLKLKAIFSIIQDTKGDIWFAACVSDGISQYDGKNLINIVPHKNIGRTDRIIQDQKGNYWFAAVFNGICFYDGNKYTKNIFNENINKGPSNIIEDNNGNLWFNTEAGLCVYDGNTVKIYNENVGFPIGELVPVLKDKKGNLWFRSSNMGLYCFDGKTFVAFSE